MIQYKNSNSTNLQESFVISMLDEKRNGYYLELGSGQPVDNNNTFLLETILNWKGLGIDINCTGNVEKYNEVRNNDCICTDAITFNYQEYFIKNNFPKQIDFLQIDLDNGLDSPIGNENYDKTNYASNIMNASGNLLALISIPLTTYRFSVIIFEHECVTNYKNKNIRDAQREILTSLGYTLIIDTGAEDWWVDPLVIKKEKYMSEYILKSNPHISVVKELTSGENKNE